MKINLILTTGSIVPYFIRTNRGDGAENLKLYKKGHVL